MPEQRLGRSWRRLSRRYRCVVDLSDGVDETIWVQSVSRLTPGLAFDRRGGSGIFSGSSANCAKVSTTAVTIIAGPLNYVGANPKIDCKVPQPSE